MTATTESENVTVIAHRGLAPGLPENTLAAFRGAIALGVDAIEIDLRVTVDGHVVVMHDDTVDRTTDGSGRVADLTLAEVKALDAGRYAGPQFGGERVPTYREVLETLQNSRIQLLLDIKDCPPDAIAAVVDCTAHYSASHQVIVGPRTIADLRAFKKLDPRLRALALIPGRQDEPADLAVITEFVDAGTDLVRLWPSWILTDDRAGAHLVRTVRELGTPVWTCADTLYNDIRPDAPADDLRRLVDAGISGIMTNLPELLLDIVRPH
ncbi:glycerophosphodiester phosphodiesterase [Nocardia sp. NPDC051052]|uniref:glycerophosphodiester phosphodiesterase n=1 Tax=Nocardia sp. NPDC051052 TaxID=3364322 RepID=UPI003799EA73